MSALATLRAAAGLEEYMDLLEERLEEAVGSQAGLVREIGTETLAAGGKRLRPLLAEHWEPLLAEPGERVWTDDFSNVLGAIDWSG